MAETKQNLNLGSDSKRNSDRPFRVRKTGEGSNKVLFETADEREARKYVQDNFPRPHHEAEDHDVYLETPTGSKLCYVAGAGDDGWGDYRTPREREDG
jgi:hypothetical protein